ncbi:MAG: methionyl-tRNA formyltransferase [Fusobacteriaceae bacterium]|jgi:methionyl-tRNA formyltransferase|nr:methionyl-tRNA formyltransferase [Fusobacteriaceae bacterium]
MKILFMGTPDFALASLKKLYEKHQILGVFTKIDKPNTRGGKIKFNPIKEYSLEKNIPIYQPKNLNNEDVKKEIKDLCPDIIVIVAYGKIIPNEIIDIPKYRAINLHTSLLPKYRGAAPINGAIINGETESGVSVIYITEKLDAGDIIIQYKVPVFESDNFMSLHDRLKEIGANALIDTIDLIEKNKVTPIKQDESLATYIKPFQRDDLKINWNKSEKEVFNFVRGLDPFPGAFSTIGDKILKISRVEENFKTYKDAKIGEVVDYIKKRGPVIATQNGSIILVSAKPENKKLLAGDDLINGRFIKIGDILS